MKRCFYCMQEILTVESNCPNCGQNPFDKKKESYHIAPGTWLGNRYYVGISEEYRGDSIIYSGYDKILQHMVSIKEYFPLEYAVRETGSINVDLYSKEFQVPFEQGLKAFISEAKKLAKFRDIDGITRIYDVFQDNNTAYQIVEAVSGCTLSDYILEKGCLPVEDTIKLLEPVALSLNKIHAEGLIHRNISPETIIIDKEGVVKLTDFGAARSTSATATKSLSVIIDPGFSPTEQYMSSGNQGAWTDVYALAATMYKCITGVTPEEAVLRSKEDSLRSPSQYGVAIDEEVEYAIMHALCTDITERTLTISDFLDELHRINKPTCGKRISGWHVYAAACLLVWILSISLSVYMLNTKKNKSNKVNLYTGAENTTADFTPEKKSTETKTEAKVTEKKVTGVKTEAKVTEKKATETKTEAKVTEKRATGTKTETKVTEKKTTEAKTEAKVTEKKTTEAKTEAKVADKKSEEKKSEKKAAAPATESNAETSDNSSDSEEILYIED